MHALRFLASVFLLTLLGACAASGPINQDVQYEFSSDAPLGQYQTFTVQSVPEASTLPKLPHMVSNGIAAAMRAKGYSAVDRSPPAQLLVRFTLRLEQTGRLNEQVIPNDQGLRTRYNFEPLTQGKLLVNIVDTRQHAIVWKGAMQKPLNDVDLDQVSQEDVDRAMARLFASFPSRDSL